MKVVPAPLDLDALRRAFASGDWATATSRRRPIGLGEVVIAADALDGLSASVDAARHPGPIVVLFDTTPMRRGNTDLKPDVVSRLRAGLSGTDIRSHALGTSGTQLHVDGAALAEADAAIEGAGCVVSVGSGTVTDVAKDATFRAGIPFVVVQTAVSVNAFSDDMAVLLHHGVKRTVPSHWPDALIIDLEVIASAPPVMNQAGFGELMGMFTAPADWYLATVVGADDSYDAEIVRLFRDGGDRLLAHASGVAAARHDALAELARQMTLTGIAMGVAGRTAPLSGAEHTISHLLDMAAPIDGRGLAFHGAQVGVASVLVAIAWSRLLREFEPARLTSDASFGTIDPLQARVASAFDRLDPTGAASAECWSDYRRKVERWNGSRAHLAAVAGSWPRHRAVLEGLVASPAAIVEGLRAAGAPTRFSELVPAIPADVARWAVASCHLMRDRFTLADLSNLTRATGPGGWDEVYADELLAEAAELGAGL